MSSLRRGHANLLCIVPIFADDLLRGSTSRVGRALNRAPRLVVLRLWAKKASTGQRKNAGAVRELNPRPLAPKARIIPLDQQPWTSEGLKNMLDGIRTRNPQIRSLMRYPLRHEHLKPACAARPSHLPGRTGPKIGAKQPTTERFELPRNFFQVISNHSP